MHISENISKQFSISRAEQDEFSYQSHMKAARARKMGYFKEEIVPVGDVSQDDGEVFRSSFVLNRFLSHLIIIFEIIFDIDQNSLPPSLALPWLCLQVSERAPLYPLSTN